MSETLARPRDDADAKAWFYLDHRRDIEEWAALRLEAGQLLDRYLLDLAPHFERLAAELNADWDGDLEMERHSWRWLGLCRRSWHNVGLQKATIGLEWYPNQLFSPHDKYEWPYLAVYAQSSGQDDVRCLAIKDDLAGVRSRLDGHAAGDYLFWRYVRSADGAQSVDPDELAHRALREFRVLWDAAAPVLDNAVNIARP